MPFPITLVGESNGIVLKVQIHQKPNGFYVSLMDYQNGVAVPDARFFDNKNDAFEFAFNCFDN